MTIGLVADPDVEDTEPGAPDAEPPSDALDALSWLIWPTDGLEGPLQAGAFRILSVDSEVVAKSVDRATVTWTVRVAACSRPVRAAARSLGSPGRPGRSRSSTCRRGRSGAADAVVEEASLDRTVAAGRRGHRPPGRGRSGRHAWPSPRRLECGAREWATGFGSAPHCALVVCRETGVGN